jgi:CheY-like chemotaxis protein
MSAANDDAGLNVLIVEDEALLALELGYLVREAGCTDVGHAMDSREALSLASALHPDLALVDVHLSDGPTGIDVARAIVEDCQAVALFMTANVKRLPADYAGACGVIGKPYSDTAVRNALVYLSACLRTGYAPGLPPVGLKLAPAFAQRWGLDETPLAV